MHHGERGIDKPQKQLYDDSIVGAEGELRKIGEKREGYFLEIGRLNWCKVGYGESETGYILSLQKRETEAYETIRRGEHIRTEGRNRKEIVEEKTSKESCQIGITLRIIKAAITL